MAIAVGTTTLVQHGSPFPVAPATKGKRLIRAANIIQPTNKVCRLNNHDKLRVKYQARPTFLNSVDFINPCLIARSIAK